MKVSQFGPALLEAWRKATEETLKVPCGHGPEGKKKAVHTRYRMYMLRTAMQKEHHPLYPATLGTKLQIKEINGNHTLIGTKVDAEIESLLQNAGVTAPALPELPDDL